MGRDEQHVLLSRSPAAGLKQDRTVLFGPVLQKIAGPEQDRKDQIFSLFFCVLVIIEVSCMDEDDGKDLINPYYCTTYLYKWLKKS